MVILQNTNALITLQSGPNLSSHNISAMMLLDHNRLLSQIAVHTGTPVSLVKDVIVWGNHSNTQVPDISYSKVGDVAGVKKLDDDWVWNTLVPAVQSRGKQIIDQQGFSSVASAANAAISHMRSWVLGTDGWISMAVLSDGSYGVEEGLMYGYPVHCIDGKHNIVQGLEISDKVKVAMQKSCDELCAEYSAVKHLL